MNNIEQAARKAWLLAREEAFAAGLSVYVTESGALFEEFPNGTKRKIKDIEPPVQIEQKIYKIGVDKSKNI